MRAKTVNDHMDFKRGISAKDTLNIGAEKFKVQSPGDGFYLYEVMLLESYTGKESIRTMGSPYEMWQAEITKIISGEYKGRFGEWSIGDIVLVKKFEENRYRWGVNSKDKEIWGYMERSKFLNNI